MTIGLGVAVLSVLMLGLDFSGRHDPRGHPFLLVMGIYGLLVAAPLIWSALLLRVGSRWALGGAIFGALWYAAIVHWALWITTWAAQLW
ncbi:MAG TPA: hypothetical protein VFL95_12675 [Gemmatimonadales bacterium]|nr:hypothetical protein [Gemmatimonadales bacterium]